MRKSTTTAVIFAALLAAAGWIGMLVFVFGSEPELSAEPAHVIPARAHPFATNPTSARAATINSREESVPLKGFADPIRFVRLMPGG